MSNEGWDPTAGLWRRILVDSDGILRTKPEGVYLAVLPTLVDEEQHRLILTVDGKLLVDDPTTQALVQDIEDKLDHAVHGLAALQALIAAIPTTPELEADALARYNALVAYVDEVESLLKNATYGLSALQVLLAAIPTTPELEADASTRYTALAAYVDEIESLLKNATYGLAALETLVDEVESLLKNGTYGLAALETLVDEVESLLKHATYGLSALQVLLAAIPTTPELEATAATRYAALIAAIGADVTPEATDEQDSFLWDTSAYGTAVQDISALFTTPLTGTTRRKYFVWIDVYAMQQDAAAWTTLQVRVNAKVDGANYRTVDGLDTSKTGFPVILVEVPPVAKDVQITFELDVALAGDATVYYHYVKEVLE